MLDSIYHNSDQVELLELRIDLWRRVKLAKQQIAAVVALAAMKDRTALGELQAWAMPGH